MGEWIVKPEDLAGLSVKLYMLSTHYAKSKDFTKKDLSATAKILRKWLSLAIPNENPVPLPVLIALSDDLNTPAAIAEMHKLSKTDGKGLFSAMKLLGLIPGSERSIDYDIVSEVKTIPIDHIPLLEWDLNQQIGFVTKNKPPTKSSDQKEMP